MFFVLEDWRRQAIERNQISDLFVTILNNIRIDDILSGQKPMLHIFLGELQVDLEFGEVALKKLSDSIDILRLKFSQTRGLGLLRKLI